MMGTQACQASSRRLGRSVEKPGSSSETSATTSLEPPSSASAMSSGRLARARVPNTTSTFLMCSRMRTPSRWAMQPPTHTMRLPLGGTGALTMAET